MTKVQIFDRVKLTEAISLNDEGVAQTGTLSAILEVLGDEAMAEVRSYYGIEVQELINFIDRLK